MGHTIFFLTLQNVWRKKRVFSRFGEKFELPTAKKWRKLGKQKRRVFILLFTLAKDISFFKELNDQTFLLSDAKIEGKNSCYLQVQCNVMFV